MKKVFKKAIGVILCTLIILSLICGCTEQSDKPVAESGGDYSTVISSTLPSDTSLHGDISASEYEDGSSEVLAESEAESQTEIKEESKTESEITTAVKTLKMKIDGKPVAVEWIDNEAVQALKKRAEEGNITVQMSMYGGFEQVGSLGESLPRNDKQTTTSAGDIVLYSGDSIVVFYGSNSWSYTRLGRITDKSQNELQALLGSGDVTLVLTLE